MESSEQVKSSTHTTHPQPPSTTKSEQPTSGHGPSSSKDKATSSSPPKPPRSSPQGPDPPVEPTKPELPKLDGNVVDGESIDGTRQQRQPDSSAQPAKPAPTTPLSSGTEGVPPPDVQSGRPSSSSPQGPDPPTEPAADLWSEWDSYQYHQDDDGDFWARTAEGAGNFFSLYVVSYFALPFFLDEKAKRFTDRVAVYVAWWAILLLLLAKPHDVHPFVLDAAGYGYAHYCALTSPHVESKKKEMKRCVALVGLLGTATAACRARNQSSVKYLIAMHINGAFVMNQYDWLHSQIGWRLLPLLSANCLAWLCFWPYLAEETMPAAVWVAAVTMRCVTRFSLGTAIVRGLTGAMAALGFEPVLPDCASGWLPDFFAHACGFTLPGREKQGGEAKQTPSGCKVTHPAQGTAPHASTQTNPSPWGDETRASSGPRPPTTVSDDAVAEQVAQSSP